MDIHNNETNEDDKKNNEIIDIQPQIEEEDKRKFILVLTHAPLEVAKLRNKYVLLNSDEHRGYINKKLNRDYSIYRPDITHQCLLSILDSPLNKAGYVDLYIHTEKNVLIHINPATKIPRTYTRFAKLMAQLLVKLKIRAQESSELLLKVVKNPITNHLPPEAMKIGLETNSKLVKLSEYVPKLPKNKPIVFVIGAVSKGNPCKEHIITKSLTTDVIYIYINRPRM